MGTFSTRIGVTDNGTEWEVERVLVLESKDSVLWGQLTSARDSCLIQPSGALGGAALPLRSHSLMSRPSSSRAGACQLVAPLENAPGDQWCYCRNTVGAQVCPGTWQAFDRKALEPAMSQRPLLFWLLGLSREPEKYPPLQPAI